MQDQLLIKKIEGNIATLTINRPEKRNSLTADLLFELIRTLEEWAEKDEVRVVVLTGTGDKAFSGGFDVRSIPTQNGAKVYRRSIIPRPPEACQRFGAKRFAPKFERP